MKRVRLESVHARSASWTKRIALFSAVLALTAAAAHRFGLLDALPMACALALAALLAVLALSVALRATARVWTYGDSGAGEIVLGVAVSVLVLMPFLYLGYQAVTLPWLYDISTDTADPPPMPVASASRLSGMNVVDGIDAAAAELQQEAYPLVKGRRYAAPADRVADIVASLLQRYGWRVVGSPADGDEDGELDFEAVARTFVLKLPVSVALRILADEDASYVDMRSAWRYGPHDFGDNAARIEAFLADLDVEVAGLAPASE